LYKNYQLCKNTLEGILAIDFFLAKSLCFSINQQYDDLLFHSIMATSQALRNGHSCLKIECESEKRNWANSKTSNDAEQVIKDSGFLFPTTEQWHHYLVKINIGPNDNQPLVYDYKRLYLRRYWLFEVELSVIINKLMINQLAFDIRQGKKILDLLFTQKTTSGNNTEIDWQKVAVANALGKQFTIIAGGPGTGKTYTVTKLLAALQALSDNSLKIALLAPTGKAAQRLNESIQKAKSSMQEQQLISFVTLSTIPDTASTIHRLLGVKTGSHNFRFNKDKLLPYDVLLIDETSMIDLPLMSRLLTAIKDNCRVIMLGDADQLPPVAAGSILSDLIPIRTPSYSKFNSQQLGQLTGYDIADSNQSFDYLSVLQKSHRFDGIGEIGQLATLVINGEIHPGWHFLQQANKQIELVEPQMINHHMDKLIEQYYVPLFSPDLQLNQAFDLLSRFRFLVVTRLGEYGLNYINEYVENYLLKNNYIKENKECYPGRPIMVTKNHYQLGLFNGDIGLLWLNKQGQLYAVFPLSIQEAKYESNQGIQQSDSDVSAYDDYNAYRWLNLGRLPTVETVYAMTIHKTQGSEFSYVALILPTQDSPILSRELLYTGITRASKQLTICAHRPVWELAVERKIRRYSGLQQRIFSS
jgi:exodeoxyribonuclease V alpha subunit